MSQDLNGYYHGGHGHGSRRRGDHRSRSDSRHHPSPHMDVDPSWAQPLQSPPSSYHGEYLSHHPTSDHATPRHLQGMAGQYSQQYASGMSSASNYTHEPTYPEGYGGSASNYTHESTYRDGYGSHPTGHEISTAYQTHQPSRTGRPEPQEMDSNPRYGMTSGQSQHTQRPNRDPTSPPRRQDFRSSISTSTTSDYSVPHLGSQTFMGRIRGGTPAESTLDPNYQVQSHPTDFFKPGRVFSTLWNESQGSTPSNRTAVSAGPVFYGRYREPIYSHIRRMVVYKTNGHCSWCFPIYTYNRQGVGKPDVIVQDHAIIHNQGAYPQLGPREPRMTKSPLEFEPFTPDQALDPMSRLNFGKIYTVEHNVKVRKVGRISHTSMATFRNYARSSMLRE